MSNKVIMKDAHFKELMRGGSIAFVLKVIGMLISFILMYFITNNFGAAQYGVLMLITSLLSISMLIIRFGTNTSLVRIIGDLQISSNIGYVNDIFLKSILITMPIAIVSFFLFILNADFLSELLYDKTIYNYKIRIGALSLFPMLILGLVAATLQGMKNILVYSFLNAIIPQLIFLLSLLVNKIVFQSDYDLIAVYVVSVYVSSMVAFVFYLIYFRPYKIIKSEHSIKSIINLSFPMLIAGSLTVLMTWTDILMLGYFDNNSNVGIYNVSSRIATTVGVIIISVNAIATPKFAELYAHEDISGLEKFVKQTTKLIFYATLPVILVIMLTGNQILSLFGNEFIAGYTVLTILIMGQFINAISGSVGYILQMTNNQKINQRILMISVVVNVILNYFLIPLCGMNGAASASMISMSFWNIAMVLAIKKKFNFWTVYIPKLLKR